MGSQKKRMTWAVVYRATNKKETGDLTKREAYRMCRTLNKDKAGGNKPYVVQRNLSGV